MLVLQRLFIRNVPEARAKKNFHAEFKTWVDKTYSGSLDEAQWDVIIADDRLHDYGSYPFEAAPQLPPPDNSEVQDTDSYLCPPGSENEDFNIAPNMAAYHFDIPQSDS